MLLSDFSGGGIHYYYYPHINCWGVRSSAHRRFRRLWWLWWWHWCWSCCVGCCVLCAHM